LNQALLFFSERAPKRFGKAFLLPPIIGSGTDLEQRQPVARELKQIYEAETAELAAKQFLASNKIRAMTGNASFDRGRKHSSDPPARNIRVV